MSLIHRHLCNFGGLWYLLSWNTEQSCGSLIVGKKMPRKEQLVSADNCHDGRRIDTLTGITFYPEVFYQGYRVFLRHWHPESSEPMVRCTINYDTISRSVKSPSVMDIVASQEKAAQTGLPEDDKRWRTLSKQWSFKNKAAISALEDDGWVQDYDSGLSRFVHVDDLDKVEGPPPEGPF
jgi:hypothetical protein